MPTTYDAAHWRDKAEQAREMARQTEDSLSRITLRQLASDYERLASSIEQYRKAEAASLARKQDATRQWDVGSRCVASALIRYHDIAMKRRRSLNIREEQLLYLLEELERCMERDVASWDKEIARVAQKRLAKLLALARRAVAETKKTE